MTGYCLRPTGRTPGLFGVPVKGNQACHCSPGPQSCPVLIQSPRAAATRLKSTCRIASSVCTTVVGYGCPCPVARNMSNLSYLSEDMSYRGCHVATVYGPRMEVAELAHLRRARDLLDREYARPLDVPAMARAALMSPSLFSRRFREAYGDTPYGYLQARRVERAMALLRGGRMSVTDVCIAVGFTSLGSFSSTFTRLTVVC